MAATPSASPTMTSIIDNQEGNTLRNAIEEISQDGKELCVATAFLSLDALSLTGAKLQDNAKVRLLFGDDAERKGRLQLLRAMRELSEADLQRTRETDPLLPGLHHVRRMIVEGRLEARCYTRQKGLLAALKDRLGGVKVTSHQMVCVRKVFNVDAREEWCRRNRV